MDPGEDSMSTLKSQASFTVVTATASVSPRGLEHTQDCARELGVSVAAEAGVVVCDGVGAYAQSGAVAQRVAESVSRYVESVGLAEGLVGCVEEAHPTLAGLEEGATTLIAVGADDDGQVSHCLVGNGSLIEVMGLDLGEDRVRLAWTDLVLPHVSFANGRPALSSFLAPGDELPRELSIGTRQTPRGSSRVYLACTDGIATDEERVFGSAPDGSTWKQVPAPLARLIAGLGARWAAMEASAEPRAILAEAIGQPLEQMLAAGLLDDDATVGAVLVRWADAGAPDGD
jgi:hypothetical protein